MAEQTNEQAPPQAPPGDNAITLAVKNQASLVAQYASKLMKNERAQEFAARVSLLARTDPKIASAIIESPDSFLTGMMACVHLDLMPNTPQQHAYLIVYNNSKKEIVDGKEVWVKRPEIQMQTGYKGLMVLARRSGEIKKLRAAIVYKGDHFVHREGLELVFEHEPNYEVDRNDKENITHAYVVATLDDGEYQVVVMSKKEIEKIREFAKKKNFGKESPAWNEWYERQALKTVIRFAAKQLPSSAEDRSKSLAAAAYLDSLAEVGKLKFNRQTEDFEPVKDAMDKPERSPEDEAAIKQEAADIAENLRRQAAAGTEPDEHPAEPQADNPDGQN